jgi:hypothetical protein
VLTRVTKVAHYSGFEDMSGHESVASVNPLATPDEQWPMSARSIHPSGKLSGLPPSASNWSTCPDWHNPVLAGQASSADSPQWWRSPARRSSTIRRAS